MDCKTVAIVTGHIIHTKPNDLFPNHTVSGCNLCRTKGSGCCLGTYMVYKPLFPGTVQLRSFDSLVMQMLAVPTPHMEAGEVKKDRYPE